MAVTWKGAAVAVQGANVVRSHGVVIPQLLSAGNCSIGKEGHTWQAGINQCSLRVLDEHKDWCEVGEEGRPASMVNESANVAKSKSVDDEDGIIVATTVPTVESSPKLTALRRRGQVEEVCITARWSLRLQTSAFCLLIGHDLPGILTNKLAWPQRGAGTNTPTLVRPEPKDLELFLRSCTHHAGLRPVLEDCKGWTLPPAERCEATISIIRRAEANDARNYPGRTIISHWQNVCDHELDVWWPLSTLCLPSARPLQFRPSVQAVLTK